LKLVQERIGSTLEHVVIGNNLLNRTLIVQQLREQTDKWDNLKLKGFCTTKERVTRLKRQPKEREKIFARYTSDMELIMKIYRDLKKLNFQRISDQITKEEMGK
jgi:CO dehydrogenase/acetyl-CoA synthase alpha subunit